MFSQLVFVDLPSWHKNLLPLTANRPLARLRVGIMRIDQKWCSLLPEVKFKSYLTVFPLCKVIEFQPTEGEYLYLNGGVLPTGQLLEAIRQLPPEHSLWSGEDWLAYRSRRVYNGQQMHFFTEQAAHKAIQWKHEGLIKHLTDLLAFNRWQIEADFAIIQQQRRSQIVSDRHTAIYGEENVFVEEGAIIRAAVINAEAGPVYIGKNAGVGEGSLIRGAFALCQEAQLNMGTIIRGDTTVGNGCKVGGEISNSIFLGYSNKVHEGFIGNSVIGEFCNLGAGTTISNMKNTMGSVRLWNYAQNNFETLDRQFCGLFMGDYSFTGIHTTFNTATVAGPGLSIFGGGIPPKFIPPFAWGTPQHLTRYQVDSLKKTLQKFWKMKNYPSDVFHNEALVDACLQLMQDYLLPNS
ncbi:MAG: putative sugar nucleotidyl transferase [Cytophagales bacterium]|nr:putative sugar nucleotidyl transferase [Bernardetiaceae bacterium]MDW8210791.1 putative sugar nucleotidyl transferase [Cytophagales bacterium]